ncbi:phosphatidylserine decarboxylase [Saccharibacillus sp. O23]|uniref:archaetidylserine decarboxylase n=1 Tax=Saccharibacillus sp. O23 TaxID=2009338 RepID=UPI000B4E5E72|nr:archaetidylserine decarboxylase [Saccharibacillus sp. O23]OWR28330.1 phosphatidylserine decarboxylase [Saccharibacillus sp. O23]
MRVIEGRTERYRQQAYGSVMRVLGSRVCSRSLKRFCDSAFSRILIPLFVRAYGIDTSEIGRPLKSYRSLTDFFVRDIHPDLRPADPDPAAVVSPVDGYVQTFGDIADDCTFEVKGKRYSFEELTSMKLGYSGFAGGKFIILYLSPAEYHHFHSPASGEGRQIAELGRRSLPVNAAGWRYGGRLLALNHRIVFEIRRRSSSLLMVAVGALNVNSIELNNPRSFWRKGEEVGYFSFGSTVVCLFERERIEWSETLQEEDRLRVGERIAIWKQKPDNAAEQGGEQACPKKCWSSKTNAESGS